MFQRLALSFTTLPILLLAPPYRAESPTVGKKLATATPTAALALIMFCSAWRMSGRRRRRRRLVQQRHAAIDRSRVGAEQRTDRVLLLRDLALERGDRRDAALEVRL